MREKRDKLRERKRINARKTEQTTSKTERTAREKEHSALKEEHAPREASFFVKSE